MNRKEILAEAEHLISVDRAAEYGDAEESFTRIADMWSAFLGGPITPRQVAVCMILLKVGRLAQNIEHPDSYIDIAGYAALGGEIKND